MAYADSMSAKGPQFCPIQDPPAAPPPMGRMQVTFLLGCQGPGQVPCARCPVSLLCPVLSICLPFDPPVCPLTLLGIANIGEPLREGLGGQKGRHTALSSRWWALRFRTGWQAAGGGGTGKSLRERSCLPGTFSKCWSSKEILAVPDWRTPEP